MSRRQEVCARSPEHPHPSVEMFLTRFVLWLASVKVTVEAKPEAWDAAQEYLKGGYKPIIYSVAEHRGHTDSPIVCWAIAKDLFPGHWSNLLLVAAKDTWSKPSMQELAQRLFGEIFLFDRRTGSFEGARTQLEALGSRVKINAQNIGASLVIFPRGTRDPDAPMKDLPVVLSRQTKAPLAVVNIHGAEAVLPKVPKEMEPEQILNIFMRRLNHQGQINVVVELADFIQPDDLKNQEMKKRFLNAHNVAS